MTRAAEKTHSFVFSGAKESTTTSIAPTSATPIRHRHRHRPDSFLTIRCSIDQRSFVGLVDCAKAE